MKTIEYRATYSGVIGPNGLLDRVEEEIIRVTTRDINSGFTKALREAQKPLGSGHRREIAKLEFWAIP
jgi:hypothetical protein